MRKHANRPPPGSLADASSPSAVPRRLLPAASPRHVDAVGEQAHARVDELMADLDLMMACYE